MEKIDIVKGALSLTAGAGVSILLGAVTGKYVDSSKGLVKVGCWIGTAAIGAWVSKEVGNVIDEKVDNVYLSIKAAAEKQLAAQKKLEAQKEQQNQEDKKEE